MVLDLFAGSAPTPGGGGRGRRGRRSVSTSLAGVHSNTTNSSSGGNNSGNRRRGRSTRDASLMVAANSEEERELFASCVAQVQRNLKAHAGSPSTLHTLASYYTRVSPHIDGRPFCVSLSYATFLFHMQMARISVSDVELYVQLIANVLSQLTDDQKLRHPFVQQVLRDHVFGLPSPTCRGAAHCVVLVPPQQYRAFSTLATALLALDVVPIDIVYQFQDRLEEYCSATSPIVANRALALLVQTVGEVRVDEQVTALQYVLRTRPVKMNVDFLLACYERLKRAVIDPAHGPMFGRALSIHCSELFLRFRSPIRREYVERFLYPSLCHPDMAGFLEIQSTREHLLRELLGLCTPGMATTCPYYLCLCALMQSSFDDEIDGALETVTLINCQMPHAAYFMSALAVDSHMAVAMFAKIVIALSRGVGLAMTGREVSDEVANCINQSRTSVYNVLFMLREVVRSCSITASRRATDMLKALRVAVPMKSIEALGKLSTEAFDGRCDITVDPQLLCAELAMVLHHEHIEAAAESAVEYFRDVTTQCHFCGMQRSASLLCPVNSTVHVTGQTSVSRVLSTLAECAGAKVLEERMIRYLREPATQMDSAVHFLLFHILSNAGQHRNAFFVQLEPYIRSTLMTLVSADRSSNRGLVTSEHKANVLMLHVKTVILLASSVDPSYLESILKVFAELRVRNNHDALALWLMGNMLLRNCKGNVDLLPTDPQENNYCVDYPGCAPTSATCADNAQLVLRLLDRAHSFSAEMRKLVGCCVCKLVQDFNVQAPNIIMSLLSSYGFVPTGLPSLAEFALPVGSGSTFWSFFLQQMKTSAPARTAFMAALAKSVSRRFRIASPADAVTSHGVEATGHLFTVMMYEAMKRNPPLARVVLFMISQWMKQGGHQPGKFICLVYVCIQLITVVVERGSGAAPVEMEAETSQDRHQFDESAKKAARLLKSQQPRLEKLLPAVRRDNTAFYHLVRRLLRKSRRTVAEATGEVVPGTLVESDTDGDDGDQGSGVGFGYEDDNEVFNAHQQQQQQHPQQPYSGTVMALRELQNTADDSVFDDYAAGDGAEDYYDAVGMEGVDTTQYGSSNATGRTLDQHTTNSSSGIAGRSATLVRSYNASSATGAAAVGDRGERIAAPQRMHTTLSGLPDSSRNDSYHHHHHHSVQTVGEISSILKRRPTAAYREDPFMTTEAPSEVRVAEGVEESVEYPRMPPISGASYRQQYQQQEQQRRHGMPLPRSQSRGVQTDDDDGGNDDERHNDVANSGRRPEQQRQMEGRHDKAVTAPFAQSVGTSPLHEEKEGQHVGSGDAKAERHTASPRVTSGGRSTWQEPDLDVYVQGDATPIEERGLPALQATTAQGDGVVLPSGMVLEYLRTHQAMDSLRHELDQLDQSTVIQEVAAYVQQHAITTPTPQPDGGNRQQQEQQQRYVVAVEGRSNNYGAPHAAAQPVPGHLVSAAVTMVATTPTARRAPVASAAPHAVPEAVEEDEEGDVTEVVDGEGPLRAVSETTLSKRRRTEAMAMTGAAVAGGAATTTPQTPSHNLRGMNFFLHQQHLTAGGAEGNGCASALQDLRLMQRQRGAMEALAQQQQTAQGEATEGNGAVGGDDADQENVSPLGRQYTAVASEGLPPTTPYGQVVIPACFVEQKNDTAIRELRQAMGAHNPNDGRLTAQGRGRIKGSGGGPAPAAGAENSGSGAWWSEMSSAPMPTYATDPQYSMELF